MVDLYQKRIPIIRRDFQEGWLGDIGESRAGAVDRDYSVQPLEAFDAPSEIDLIPESEYDARYEEREEQQSGLEHLYLRGGTPAFKHLDQNPEPYCWAYGAVHAVMLQAMAMGQNPVVRLSAHAVGCKIKDFRRAGGWGGLAAAFIEEHGCPSVDAWPEKSMKRQYDNPEVWADAAKHKITDQWVDLNKHYAERNLTSRQMFTASFNNQPGPVDYTDFASHTVCRISTVRIEPGYWGHMILNSWWGWGYHGLGIIPVKIKINAALAIRSVTIS